MVYYLAKTSKGNYPLWVVPCDLGVVYVLATTKRNAADWVHWSGWCETSHIHRDNIKPLTLDESQNEITIAWPLAKRLLVADAVYSNPPERTLAKTEYGHVVASTFAPPGLKLN